MRVILDKSNVGSYLPLSLEEVTLQVGESLTIWLNTVLVPDRLAVQLELRVLPDGTPEIFAAGWANLKLQSFEKWNSLKSLEVSDG